MRTEVDVDHFAGGGGSSKGMERAMGKPVDYASNHDRWAMAMHEANHTQTIHLLNDIHSIDAVEFGRVHRVRVAWFSPECQFFSKAKGGRLMTSERAQASRALGWVVVEWARAVGPRLIIVENVEEWLGWGPLGADGRPERARDGETFRAWCAAMVDAGYTLEHRNLRACDYGSPTVRKRLVLIARCDGSPIAWPAPTHGPGQREAHRTAAQCIDWTLPLHSLFLDRRAARALGCRRPLAPATLRRVARGVRKYILDTEKPFWAPEPITGLAHHRSDDAQRLLRTYAGSPSTRTGVEDNDAATATALCINHQYTSNGCGGDGRLTRPMKTITTGGNAALVGAMIIKYYSEGGQHARCSAPAPTLTTRDRLGLVGAAIRANQVVDIGMRMLSPRELFNAQGFPARYVIDPQVDGRPLSRRRQVGMAGNAVCPDMAEAVLRANLNASGEAALAA